jgi:SAM-dependent methyltransferase
MTMAPQAQDRLSAGSYWDDVVEAWEPTLVHRLWRAHSDAVNIELLRRWLPADAGIVLKTDLFDEAVGRGLYTELADRSSEVHGVDLSAAAVAAAGRRYPGLEARRADVLALPFPDASFDAVVSNSTLDHFETHAELRAGVAEIGRTIRPGGILVITLDNRSNPIVALRTTALLRPLQRLGAIPYFVGATHGPRGLARLLRETGFEVAELAAFMHCPPQLAARRAVSSGAVSESGEGTDRHLRRVLRFERMGNWPTRYLTAHFVGALAIRR